MPIDSLVVTSLGVGEVRRSPLTSRPNLESSITQLDFTRSPIIITPGLERRITEKEKKYKHDPIPVIVFGLVGTIVGGYIGSRFDPTTYVPGEFPELFTKGILIGMGLGAIAGGVIGYFLGKEEVKENKTSGSTQVEDTSP